MNFRFLKTTLAAVAFAAAGVLAACGGGGSSGTSATPAAPGTTPTGATTTSVVANGPITAFGSVFVNGVRFDTSGAQIEIEGRAGTQAELKVGHVIELKGSRSNSDGTGTGTGTATRIVRRSAVRGPIAAIDATTKRITVLGQTVLVTASTSFDDSISPADLTGLKVDDVIEVHGLPNASAQIEATRIEKAAAGAVWKVVAKVTTVDTANKKLTINGLTVNYSTATLSDFASGAPAAGDLVEVKGTSLNANKELVATSVENVGVKAMKPDDANGEVELEGFVTRFVSATDFDVAGKPVTTTSSTTYEGGTAADLKLNARVEAEGALNASGVLVAAKVKFRTQAGVRLAGTVDAISAAGATPTTVTVLGIEVTVNAMTRLEDKTAGKSQFFKFADIKTGDRLEIRGYESPANSGKVVALRLERVPASTSTSAFLRGPIRTATSPNFTILNVTVATTPTTQFRNDSSSPTLTQAQFFATPNLVGQKVSAVGTFATGTLTATKVELDANDD
jgi:hypothetical protein